MEDIDILYDVKGYEGFYRLNKRGQVWSCRFNRFMVANLQGKIGSQYYKFSLKKDGEKARSYYMHQLIGKHFLDNSNNYREIDHIDGDKLNNSIENLRWCSRSMNMLNKKKAKNNKSGYKNILTYDPKDCNKVYWVIQIKCNGTYYRKAYDKNIYSLDDIINIRNEKYDEMGLRRYD